MATPADQRMKAEPGMSRLLQPPFATNTAARKARLAEDLWNSRNPDAVVQACTPDCEWRNRTERLVGRPAILNFLVRKWELELDSRMITEVWATCGARIAVRFACEWHDGFGNWYRSFGNENWECDGAGLMRRRLASVNDLGIAEEDRLFLWPPGRRPDDHPGLTDLGL
jgi:nuclear transport factor 2 (NTF2) superfamily protein